MKKSKDISIITVPKPSRAHVTVKVKNLPGSSLLMHRISESAMEEIEAKNTGKAILKKPPKDIQKLFTECQYRTSDGRLGLPGLHFHAAMRDAFEEAGFENKKVIKHSIKINPSIIPFKSHSQPILAKDFLKLPKAGRQLTIRAEIIDWELHLPIIFDSNHITVEQVINLLDLAGFHCGVGDNRPNSPKCSGAHGMFEVIRN